MPDIKIKICGLFRECDIEYANELKPDYIGFVFAKSKRQIEINTAYKFKTKLNSKIKAVGVFVNEKPEIIAKLANEGIIDVIQLHGEEDNRYIDILRKLTDKQIMKACRIVKEQDIKAAEKSNADMILFDSTTGGSGTCFNWKLIKKIEIPYFLAGGINTSNIFQALEKNPYAVDISSGVETDGKKDFNKIKSIIQTVREYKESI